MFPEITHIIIYTTQNSLTLKCVAYAPVGVGRRGSFVVEGCRKQLKVERKENWATEKDTWSIYSSGYFFLLRYKSHEVTGMFVCVCVCVTWDRPGEGAGSGTEGWDGADGGPDRGWGALFISPETSALRRSTYLQNLKRKRDVNDKSFLFCSNVTFIK